MNEKRTIEAFGLSDRGRVREQNEDAFAVDRALGLLVVSDGMGGQRAGQVASRVVVETLPRQIAAASLGGELMDADRAGEVMGQAIAILGELMLEKSRGYAQLYGMGATVVAGWAVAGTLVLGHLGDSRAYLLRHGVLERLTEDHTIAELLLQQGLIDRRRYRDHPGRGQLRRYLGMRDCPAPDVGLLELQPADRILLCSDGLTGMLSDRQIGQTLLEKADRQAACRQLVELANEAGGRDNITVVVADVPAEGPPPQRPARVKVRRKIGQSLRRVDVGREIVLEACDEPESEEGTSHGPES